MSTAFEQSVLAVRGGADVADEAGRLYDQLTEEERLSLLDGDTPFWQGMAEMLETGYNTTPTSTVRSRVWASPAPASSTAPAGA